MTLFLTFLSETAAMLENREESPLGRKVPFPIRIPTNSAHCTLIGQCAMLRQINRLDGRCYRDNHAAQQECPRFLLKRIEINT